MCWCNEKSWWQNINIFPRIGFIVVSDKWKKNFEFRNFWNSFDLKMNVKLKTFVIEDTTRYYLTNFHLLIIFFVNWLTTEPMTWLIASLFENFSSFWQEKFLQNNWDAGPMSRNIASLLCKLSPITIQDAVFKKSDIGSWIFGQLELKKLMQERRISASKKSS